jgi:hypothetical protein
MYKALATIVLSLTLLTGCVGFGGSNTQALSKTTYTTPDGYVVEQENKGSAKASGDSTEPAEVVTPETSIEINPDGSAIIKTGQGSSTGVAASISQLAQGFLKWPIMIGFAAFAVGVALWIFLPVKKVGMSVALGGIAMATAAYLLAAYAWVAGLAALVALVGVGVYIVYKYNRSNLANKENVDVIETLKDRYLTDEEQKTAFTSKTAEIPGRQSPSTRKLIREMRKDLGWTRT